MIEKSRGILLHRIKYSDSKLILKVLTKNFGLKTFVFYKSLSKQKVFLNNILQPLYILDLSFYNKEFSMSKIKELSVCCPFKTVSFDIRKQSISFFIAEFLSKTLQENREDEELYEYVEKSVTVLDTVKSGVQDFHLFFLFHLAEFLGILPYNNYDSAKKIFDLKEGRFITGYPSHGNFLPERESEVLYSLSNSEKYEIYDLSLSKRERRSMLDGLILYFNLHLERPGHLKTPEILSSLFS